VVNKITKFVIIALYLWLLLTLVGLQGILILGREPLQYQEQIVAIVTALVSAAAILVADSSKIGSYFKYQPLIYSILWRSAVAAVLVICFRVDEDAVRAWLQSKTLGESVAVSEILAAGAIFFVTLIPFSSSWKSEALSARNSFGACSSHATGARALSRSGANSDL
jgi:phosphoglycerol transferase MdoB-like AlkP superfamily enzyme